MLRLVCLTVYSWDLGCFKMQVPGAQLQPTELKLLQMDPGNVFFSLFRSSLFDLVVMGLNYKGNPYSKSKYILK